MMTFTFNCTRQYENVKPTSASITQGPRLPKNQEINDRVRDSGGDRGGVCTVFCLDLQFFLKKQVFTGLLGPNLW
jgi:hypothetical protein